MYEILDLPWCEVSVNDFERLLQHVLSRPRIAWRTLGRQASRTMAAIPMLTCEINCVEASLPAPGVSTIHRYELVGMFLVPGIGGVAIFRHIFGRQQAVAVRGLNHLRV
jgi:hypothetical protein